MKSAHDVILAPVITEKSMSAIADKKYTFKVDKNSGKVEIARAVEELFDVKVSKVNTMTVPGQKRRQGRYEGYTSEWKKAVVKLTADSKGIAFFESMT